MKSKKTYVTRARRIFSSVKKRYVTCITRVTDAFIIFTHIDYIVTYLICLVATSVTKNNTPTRMKKAKKQYAEHLRAYNNGFFNGYIREIVLDYV